MEQRETKRYDGEQKEDLREASGDASVAPAIRSSCQEEARSVRIALEPKSLEHLLWYVDQSRPVHLAEGEASKDYLFLSQSQNPLTKNSIVLLFGRLRKRAGVSGTPQLLRHSFALRYLQTGGDPCDLRELLGYDGMGKVKQYLR